MNKGRVRDSARANEKREVLEKVLRVKGVTKKSTYGKRLAKKSRKELERMLI